MNRDGGIRTRDPLNPIQVRYRAALRPVLTPQSPAARTERESYTPGALPTTPSIIT